MKKLTAILTFVLLVLQTGCSEGTPTDANNEQREGSLLMDSDILLKELNARIQEEATPEIIHGLVFMREEEKLARDIYIMMGRTYNLRIFNNIAQSEQRHMNAVKLLLDRYSIPDPVGNNDIGVFSDSSLQELYNTLLAEGLKSSRDAIAVGKLIEETDIKDLDVHLAELRNESDIKFVYQNLRKGSENHLRAFTRNL